jgi:hypothetical protein
MLSDVTVLPSLSSKGESPLCHGLFNGKATMFGLWLLKEWGKKGDS